MTRWTIALAAFAGSLAACGVPFDESARRVPPERVPYNLLDPDPIQPQEQALSGTPSLVYVVKADRLRPVPVLVPPDAAPLEVLALLEVAVGRVSDARSVLQAGDVVAAILDAEGILTVDVDPALLQLPGGEQVLAIAQIVLTMNEQPGVTGVVFTSQGQPLAVARTDGSIIEGPATRADLANLVG